MMTSFISQALVLIALSATAGQKAKLDPDLQDAMQSSTKIIDAKRLLLQNNRQAPNERSRRRLLWDQFEAFLALEMDDSIQSTGAKLLGSPDTSVACSYRIAIATATSAYRSERFELARSTIESIALRCPTAHSSNSFREFYSRPLSNLMARLLSQENKADSSLLILAPWINDGLSIVAYRIISQSPKGDLCRDLDIAFTNGLQTGVPRPQASSPLLQILLNANHSPYEQSIRLEKPNLTIPIYTDQSPPTQQALADAVSRFKSSFFYTGSDCDLQSTH